MSDDESQSIEDEQKYEDEKEDSSINLNKDDDSKSNEAFEEEVIPNFHTTSDKCNIFFYDPIEKIHFILNQRTKITVGRFVKFLESTAVSMDYETQECEHDLVKTEVQNRRADELFTVVISCKKCSFYREQ